MSQLGDEVLDRLTGEWQTVAEIAAQIEKHPRKAEITHKEMIRTHLESLVAYDIAERTEERPVRYRRAKP